MLERIGRAGEARALALAVTALGDAVPFVLDARRSLMATDILDEVTPALARYAPANGRAFSRQRSALPHECV